MGVGDDAPGTEIKIVLENSDTITIEGDALSFNYRLWQIYERLYKSTMIEDFEEDSIQFKFLSEKFLDK